MQARELGAHADAELRVEVRQRLVHEVRGRLAHDCAAHRDTLPLSAGKRPGPAVEHRLEAEQAGRVLDPAANLGLRRPPHLQSVGEILADVHVRVERVVLKHHCDVAFARREARHVPLADRDRPAGDRLEPGEHPQ